jgi:hypothetical protein
LEIIRNIGYKQPPWLLFKILIKFAIIDVP